MPEPDADGVRERVLVEVERLTELARGALDPKRPARQPGLFDSALENAL